MSKQAKFEDSNIALIGTDLDIEQRVKAAKTEKEWVGCGLKEGIEIWRIEKFNVKKWPLDHYGEFYTGDSYIILHTKKHENKLKHNIHFWIGVSSSQDEYGTAAYKTVELDDFFGGEPIQFRECQGHESKSFTSLFKNPIKLLQGGIESGFNHVKPEEYKPKLLHVKGNYNVHVDEVECKTSSLNNGDVFVLDSGLKVYVWNGPKSAKSEQYTGNMTADSIKHSRKGCEVFILKEDGHDSFWKILGGKATIKDKEVEEDAHLVNSKRKHEIHQLHEDKGKFSFKKIAEGELKYSMLKSDDVFICDLGDAIITWIGKDSSVLEKKKALIYANQYIGLNKRPVWLPIITLKQGQEGRKFFETVKK